ncbi:MAG: hypothetical protein MEP44_09535 [Blastomonas sp.]|nr:hypothetical protein [Blastomonas sp.]
MIKLYTGWRPLLPSDLSMDRCSKDEARRTPLHAKASSPLASTANMDD